MLALTCVLESLSLTGLTLHEWLGFILCPLVLMHVVLQWQWFAAQFRRVLVAGAYRPRLNVLLNLLLLVLMAAVLFSGVLSSNQVVPLVREYFGRTRVWSEIHGWLNFALIVAVGLHLGLNWDWLLAMLRQRESPRPALATPTLKTPSSTATQRPQAVVSLWRGAVVFTAASVAACAVYLAMAPMLPPQETHSQTSVSIQAQNEPPNPPPRQGRPVSLHTGLGELAQTVLVILVVILTTRYLLRVHL